MPLLGDGNYKEINATQPRDQASSEPKEAEIKNAQAKNDALSRSAPKRRQSQHSGMAKSVMNQTANAQANAQAQQASVNVGAARTATAVVEAIAHDLQHVNFANGTAGDPMGPPANPHHRSASFAAGIGHKTSTSLNGSRQVSSTYGHTLTDTPVSTPATTAPNSPIIMPKRQNSGSASLPRPRAATTLDIPGLTRSRASPDGRISQKDLGSKLVIVMVGLPARGKSYVTKKIARYLNWLQHDTKIFNVGERRRIVAGTACSNHKRINQSENPPQPEWSRRATNGVPKDTSSEVRQNVTPPTSPSTAIHLNGDTIPATPPLDKLPPSAFNYVEEICRQCATHVPEDHSPTTGVSPTKIVDTGAGPEDSMEQTADFFDPTNTRALCIRETVAMETLDELLDYVIDEGGSVGIFDATNSTLERRKAIIEKVRQRAGLELGVLFLESLCIDENLLESNMRLKLSGPDYRDQNPVVALADFKKRVAMYEKRYVPLGEYEEKNDMPYVQMIDVGRKIVSHQIRGFLSAQTVYYLLNFNLAPRQIWITRHGESVDNLKGKIGGDSDLSIRGLAYAHALTNFIKHEREAWEIRQRDKARSNHLPSTPSETDKIPSDPEYNLSSVHSTMRESSNKGATGEPSNVTPSAKSFCVWTSMLKRSIQTAQFFDEEEFDIKQMKMLDELNAGVMEGLTYDEIKKKHAWEYELRKRDKLHYRYPGAGGECYLDIIHRLRAVIVEVERMMDHVLLVGHRSVARVLLAYFKGLARTEVADLDVPIGMLYMLEPKPYGVDFKAYKYNPDSDWFDHVSGYELKPSAHPGGP